MRSPRLLLKLEGAAVLLFSVLAYRWHHGSWILFAVLFLVPDVSMLGYVANSRVGAARYNSVHTYLGPLLLGCYAVPTAHLMLLQVCLIWTAHIGFDRFLGFGLKYPTQFKDTHLDPERHTARNNDLPIKARF